MITESNLLHRSEILTAQSRGVARKAAQKRKDKIAQAEKRECLYISAWVGLVLLYLVYLYFKN